MVRNPNESGARSPALTEGQLRATLDAVVLETIRNLLPGLIVLYLIVSALHVGASECPAARALGWISAFSAVSSSLIWILLIRGSIRVDWAQPLGSLVGVIALLDALAHIYPYSGAFEGSIPVLALLGAGVIFLSLRWPEALLLASVAGWGLMASIELPFAARIQSGFAILGATLVSVAVYNARLSSTGRLYWKRIKEELRQQAVKDNVERSAVALRGEMDGLWDWDLEADRLYFSPRWKSMLGYTEEEVGTTPGDWFDRVHPHDLDGLMRDLSLHIEGETPHFEREHRILQAAGTYRWVLARGVTVRDEEGKATRIVGSQIDITQLKSFEKRLLHDAYHDRLTGLPNRDFLMARLEEAIAANKRNPDYTFAVIFLDLDRFKVTNDSLGHLVGDQLLAAVAERLKECQRSGDTTARIGGDEFVILLAGLQHPDEATQVAARIQEVLTPSFHLVRHQVVTTASIGIALSTSHFERPEDLLRNADIAMYHAKSRSKGQIQVFNSDMHVRTVRLWSLENDLRRALSRQELVLHYQPFVSLESGKICGAEALVRWRRSSGELVSPAEFIPIAEELGLIVEIGEWVMWAACAQNKAWHDAGLRPLSISVNLSARQLQEKDFPRTVKRVLAQSKLDPDWLELELTESALMDSADVGPASLHALFDMGIRTAIDDFGTGYSSLSHLRRLKFNTLKIDRSFVNDITRDDNAAALTRGMITLAHNLQLKVVAEGVESRDQLLFLHWNCCDQVQGYLASRPLVVKDFTDLLTADRPLLEQHLTASPEEALEATNKSFRVRPAATALEPSSTGALLVGRS